jgi:hypothetical protein
MSRFEFLLVVTQVELTEEQRLRVGRAVALAGAAELGAALPRGCETVHHKRAAGRAP